MRLPGGECDGRPHCEERRGGDRCASRSSEQTAGGSVSHAGTGYTTSVPVDRAQPEIRSAYDHLTKEETSLGGRSPIGRGRALKPPPVRVRVPPSPPYEPYSHHHQKNPGPGVQTIRSCPQKASQAASEPSETVERGLMSDRDLMPRSSSNGGLNTASLILLSST